MRIAQKVFLWWLVFLYVLAIIVASAVIPWTLIAVGLITAALCIWVIATA